MHLNGGGGGEGGVGKDHLMTGKLLGMSKWTEDLFYEKIMSVKFIGISHERLQDHWSSDFLKFELS